MICSPLSCILVACLSEWPPVRLSCSAVAFRLPSFFHSPLPCSSIAARATNHNSIRANPSIPSSSSSKPIVGSCVATSRGRHVFDPPNQSKCCTNRVQSVPGCRLGAESLSSCERTV
ncbi:uncharacterized protein BO95DRAFT_288235 [Aspergillus brunneoviolaceus CBS 621.78]|uniref:Uncharacterized protein n=1 Tax=Aspergillus brunneoviolaceus CBS 621.78 TaxID=1450534 RepID=A0ACD1FV91_9EURO|nr:hypothetical protein BO95DRAFT_288235 [Aspergillus brunneoviolaceus CBS 621.78]RAH40846.1 hypothetical protein BO95DRAFT_288235 [Aspergillus brunneoviolaceus CBS 621.78]